MDTTAASFEEEAPFARDICNREFHAGILIGNLMSARNQLDLFSSTRCEYLGLVTLVRPRTKHISADVLVPEALFRADQESQSSSRTDLTIRTIEKQDLL